MHFDLSLNAIVTALTVAAIVGAFKIGLSTAMVLREVRAEFHGHEKLDEARHDDLEKRLAAAGR